MHARLPRMTWLGLLVGIACALSPQGSADTVGLTAYGTTQVNAAVERWLSSGGYRRAPAMSVAVGVNGNWCLRGATARPDRDCRQPNTPSTISDLYQSNSLRQQ